MTVKRMKTVFTNDTNGTTGIINGTIGIPLVQP